MQVSVMSEQKTYLEQVLVSKGWTIDKLARETDMSYSQMWEIVTKGFRLGTRLGNIERIAEVLGISVTDLLDNHLRQE